MPRQRCLQRQWSDRGGVRRAEPSSPDKISPAAPEHVYTTRKIHLCFIETRRETTQGSKACLAAADWGILRSSSRPFRHQRDRLVPIDSQSNNFVGVRIGLCGEGWSALSGTRDGIRKRISSNFVLSVEQSYSFVQSQERRIRERFVANPVFFSTKTSIVAMNQSPGPLALILILGTLEIVFARAQF